MIELLKYIKIQIKRASKLYPSIIIFTLVITTSLSVFLVNMMESDSDKESRKKAQIGIVGDMEDSYLSLGVTAVKDLDASKDYIDFVPMAEEDALRKLENDEIVGYVYFPDNFVQDAIKGKDTKLIFYANNSPSALGPIMMEEVIAIVSNMVTQSQNGTYGYKAVAKDNNVNEAIRKLQTRLISIDYATKIINRKSTYEVNTLGVEDGLSFKNYYFGAVLIIVLLLCGIVCAQLLVKTDMSFSRLLYAKGQKTFIQLLGEYLPFAIMMILNFMIMMAGVGYILSDNIETMGIMTNLTNVTDYLHFGLKLIPIVLLITMMQFLIYEVTTSIISGVLLQMLATISLVFLSGFIFPLSTLPKVMQNVSAVLPTGVAFSYLRDIATNSDITDSLIAVLISFAVLFSICAVVRRTKIKGAIA